MLLLPTSITASNEPAGKASGGEASKLSKLWKEYQKADDADLPQKQISILESIKTQALKSNSTWDFYDACTKSTELKISLNWKEQESFRQAFRAEIEESKLAVAIYYMRRGENKDSLQKFIFDNEKALRGSSNPEFWKRDWKLSSYKFYKPLLKLLKNDFDYCLWSLFPDEKMASEYKAYPLEAFVAYEAADKNNEQDLNSFANKYEGKAVALFAREDLLRLKFWELEQKNGQSEEFLALRQDCLALIDEAKHFKGAEKEIAACCQGAEELVREMDEKGLRLTIENSILQLSFVNTQSATVQLFQKGKKLWESKLENTTGSYHVPDTLRLPLPLLPDGSYSLKYFSGSIKNEAEWERYSISTAVRSNSKGLGIWATDFISGEPLDSVDLELLSMGTPIQTYKGLILNGFTPIPKEITQLIDSKKDYELRVTKGNRSSQTFRLAGTNSYSSSDKPNKPNCTILTDRSAFHPGETVHFKAILYQGLYSIRAYPSNTQVKVFITDTQGKVLEEQQLSSNQYGSVAGSFVLPRTERNGYYCLCLELSGKTIGRKHILVDDFVLPSFDLVFDPTPDYEQGVKSITLSGSLKAYSGHSLAGATIEYSANHNWEEWKNGQVELKGDRFSLTFPTDSTKRSAWDNYAVTIKVTTVTGETMEFQKMVFLKPATKEQLEFEHQFVDIEAPDSIGAEVTSGTKITWLAVELYGTNNELLEKNLVEFSPSEGNFAKTTICYPYKSNYPAAVKLLLTYFQDGSFYSHTVEKRRKDTRYDLPLSFTRFFDSTSPGAKYSFIINTLPGAEVAASIFDKSTERFMPNDWEKICAEGAPMPSVYVLGTPGIDIAYSYGPLRYSRSSKAATLKEVNSLDMVVDESADMAVGSVVQEPVSVVIREDFATTIAWDPFLKADDKGNAELSFTTLGKLSTFYVQLFAHDSALRNNTLRKEMVVTLPVKLSLAEPQFLYEGDKWNVRLGLSNNLATNVKGKLTLSFYNGSDHLNCEPISVKEESVVVEALSSSYITVPFEALSLDGALGLKVVFSPDDIRNASDAMFIAVPVQRPEQSFTEAHSALLMHGANKAALEESLRKAFVNVPGNSAVVREIAIKDMLAEALPKAIKPQSDNAIELSKALCAALLCDSLGLSYDFDRPSATAKLLALQGPDGGFAWFKGMRSSALITAVVLQRLSDHIPNSAAAVAYLDKNWKHSLSIEEYLYVRSLFPSIPFAQKQDSDFYKQAKKYLVPCSRRGLNGEILAKVRRLLTLGNLVASPQGLAFANSLGIKLFTASRLTRSTEADVASLLQYSVAHPSGGYYFPNAVMPFRGLLEDELYAHSLICKLLDKHNHNDISNGIRLWIMVQKETQNWENAPGYIEALAAVSKASEELLNTRILALSATFIKAFADTKKTGNGMSIRTCGPNTLKIGERITLTTTLSNDENRSFVHLILPHSAGLVPVNQQSGYSFGAYRSVMADRIELWFESYPEGKTSIEEEYYVTRSGDFQLAPAQIECLYAPHYRAISEAADSQIINDSKE